MKLQTTVALLYLVTFSSSVAIADTFSDDAKDRFLELVNFKLDHYPLFDNSKGVFIQETEETGECQYSMYQMTEFTYTSSKGEKKGGWELTTVFDPGDLNLASSQLFKSSGLFLIPTAGSDEQTQIFYDSASEKFASEFQDLLASFVQSCE